MKKLLCLLLAAFSASAATITGPIGDITGSRYSPRIEFWPLSTPFSSGLTNIVGPKKTVTVTNGNFAINLLTGRYLVTFLPTTNYINIVVPNNNNTYSLAEVATNQASVSGLSQTAWILADGGPGTNNRFYGTVSFPATGVSNLVWTATNSTGAGFWAAAQGGTTYNLADSTNLPQSGVTGLPAAIAAKQTTNSDYAGVTAFSTSGGLVTPGGSGFVGFTFTLRSNITVTALGRYVVAGNSNKHFLNIYRTNDLLLLGRAELATAGKETGFHYAQLPVPAMLQKDVGYAVTSWEYGTDQYYTVGGAVTTTDDIIPVYGVGTTTPAGFASWAGLILGPVNFRYTRNALSSQDFPPNGMDDIRPTLTAPRAVFDVVKSSLEDGYNAPAVVDLSILEPNVPSLGLDGWAWYYSGSNGVAGDLPKQSDMIDWAVAMRTNGMLSAGWDIISVDDHWFWATNITDGALLTNMNHFTNYAVVRDSAGVLQAHPTNFSMGIPAVISAVRTNGLRWRHYMPFRTNMVHLYADVRYAARAGSAEFFLDTTVGGETYFDGQRARDHHRRRVRVFQSAMLDAFENNTAGFSTNENRYMRLHTGGTAFGAQDTTNVLFNADSFYGIQANTFSGEDVSTLSNVVAKVKKTWPWRWWIRPGYYPDFQLMAWDPAESTNVYRGKLNVMAMGAGSMVTGPAALQRTVPADNYVLTNREFYAIWQDAAVSPAYATHSNALNEVWVRSLGHRSRGTNFGPTNAVLFINLNTTEQAFTLNVTNFAGDSNVVYTVRDPWFQTNTTFTDQMSFTVPPTNTHLVVVRPEGNFIAKGDGTAAVAGTDYLAPSGDGSALTALNASQLTTGTVPNARLDADLQTWATISPTNAAASNKWIRATSASTAEWTDLPASGTGDFVLANNNHANGSNTLNHLYVYGDAIFDGAFQAAVFVVTNGFYTGVTNAPFTGTDADGKLVAAYNGSGLTNLMFPYAAATLLGTNLALAVNANISVEVTNHVHITNWPALAVNGNWFNTTFTNSTANNHNLYVPTNILTANLTNSIGTFAALDGFGGTNWSITLSNRQRGKLFGDFSGNTVSSGMAGFRHW